MRNKKGFTLVEILAVIVIIALLAGLVIPAVIKNVKKGKDEYNTSLEKELILVAKEYYSENLSELPRGTYNEQGIPIYLKLLWSSYLTSNNYLTNELVDADGNSCDGSYIVIQKGDEIGKYNYTACLLCGTEGYKTESEYCSFININDSVTPTCTATLNSTPINGWVKDNVNVTFSGYDNNGVSVFVINTNTYKASNNVVNYISSDDIIDSLEGIVYDTSGNIGSCRLTTTVRVDDKGPELSIVNSSAGKWTNKDINLTLNGTDSESGVDYYELSYDKNTWTNSIWTESNENHAKTSWNSLQDKTVYLRAKDKVGNYSEIKQTDIKIEKEAPSGTLILSSSNGYTLKATLSNLTDTGGSNIASTYKYALSTNSTCSGATYIEEITTEKIFDDQLSKNTPYYACAIIKDNAENEKTLYSNSVTLPQTNIILLSNTDNIVDGESFNTEYGDTSTVASTVTDSASKEYTVRLPLSMKYVFQLWGAQGGRSAWHAAYENDNSSTGGYGGFSTGTKTLDANTTIYVNVGGRGGFHEGKYTSYAGWYGGYNGGGLAALKYQVSAGAGEGGGATHIATISGEIKNVTDTSKILIVAGGGGGGAWSYPYTGSGTNKCNKSIGWCNAIGGSGGGYWGIEGGGDYPTQDCAGNGGWQQKTYSNECYQSCGSNCSSTYTYYGIGQMTFQNTNGYYYGGAGGGGFYGGGGGWGTASIPGGGGGGSGYIIGVDHDNSVTNYMCYYSVDATSSHESTDLSYYTKATTIKAVSPTICAGKINNGYARVTASNGAGGFYEGTMYYKSVASLTTKQTFTLTETIDISKIHCDNNSAININGTTLTITSGNSNDVCRIYK